MKKIKVRDKSGDDFEIEEVEEKVETKEAPEKEELSKDDIAALKQLAGKVKDILALLENKIDKDGDELDEEEEVELDENGEELDVDGILAREEKLEKEEIVKDSKKIVDSQSSVGSIEKKFEVRAENANETEIASAWDKFYASQL